MCQQPLFRRAREEASRRGLSVEFSVGDMRRCDELHGTQFDVVVSADNSVPHLLSDQDLLTAYRAFFACTRPGGVSLVTVRDYAREDRSSPQLRPYGVRTTAAGRYVVFQCWDFDRDQYDVTMYFLHESADAAPTLTEGRSRYYAVGIDTLLTLMQWAGFADVTRLDGNFFQPVLLGRRAA